MEARGLNGKLPDDLRAVAKRMVWFKTPEEAIAYPELLLARVMTYGTLDDIATTLKYYSEADFEAVLDHRRRGFSIDAHGTTGICATIMTRFLPCRGGRFPDLSWCRMMPDATGRDLEGTNLRTNGERLGPERGPAKCRFGVGVEKPNKARKWHRRGGEGRMSNVEESRPKDLPVALRP